jgi:hypothetical protein
MRLELVVPRGDRLKETLFLLFVSLFCNENERKTKGVAEYYSEIQGLPLCGKLIVEQC